MAALDFPDSPTTGDLFGSTGTVWRWDGARWASTAGAGGPRGAVAFARVTATQSGITTTTDITGLSATWVADPTRVYKLTAQTFPQMVANDMGSTFIRSAAGVQVAQNDPGAQYLNYGKVATLTCVLTGLSGPQTYKVSMSRSVGSGAMSNLASPNYPSLFVVEDITYEAGTSGVGVESTGWLPITPLLTSPWVVYSAPYGIPAGYRKVGDIVTLRGLFTAGPVTGSVLTFPVGFRPPYDPIFTVACLSGQAEVRITAAGGVLSVASVFPAGTANPSGWLSLSQISFSVNP